MQLLSSRAEETIDRLIRFAYGDQTLVNESLRRYNAGEIGDLVGYIRLHRKPPSDQDSHSYETTDYYLMTAVCEGATMFIGAYDPKEDYISDKLSIYSFHDAESVVIAYDDAVKRELENVRIYHVIIGEELSDGEIRVLRHKQTGV